MAISATPLEMQAKKLSASISKVKGEVRCSSTRLKTSWFSHRAYIKVFFRARGEMYLWLKMILRWHHCTKVGMRTRSNWLRQLHRLRRNSVPCVLRHNFAQLA